MNRPLPRRQKYRVHHASIEQLEARYQCKTCPEVIEHDAQKPYERKPAGTNPRPAGTLMSPAHRGGEA